MSQTKTNVRAAVPGPVLLHLEFCHCQPAMQLRPSVRDRGGVADRAGSLARYGVSLAKSVHISLCQPLAC